MTAPHDCSERGACRRRHCCTVPPTARPAGLRLLSEDGALQVRAHLPRHTHSCPSCSIAYVLLAWHPNFVWHPSVSGLAQPAGSTIRPSLQWPLTAKVCPSAPASLSAASLSAQVVASLAQHASSIMEIRNLDLICLYSTVLVSMTLRMEFSSIKFHALKQKGCPLQADAAAQPEWQLSICSHATACTTGRMLCQNTAANMVTLLKGQQQLEMIYWRLAGMLPESAQRDVSRPSRNQARYSYPASQRCRYSRSISDSMRFFTSDCRMRGQRQGWYRGVAKHKQQSTQT